MLKILPEESIDSFYTRNLIYLQRASADELKADICLSPKLYSWNIEVLAKMAKSMGLPDDKGTSLLINKHTNYMSSSLVERDLKNRALQPSNEGLREFIRRRINRQDVIKMCPVCAKEDHRGIGVVYGRRIHQHSLVEVCPYHNVGLLHKCQTCKITFCIENNSCVQIWRPCECGLEVFDRVPSRNEDQWLLALAQFSNDINTSERKYLQAGVIGLVVTKILGGQLTGNAKEDLVSLEKFFEVESSEYVASRFRIALKKFFDDLYRQPLSWDEYIVLLCVIFKDYKCFQNAAKDFNVPERTSSLIEWSLRVDYGFSYLAPPVMES